MDNHNIQGKVVIYTLGKINESTEQELVSTLRQTGFSVKTINSVMDFNEWRNDNHSADLVITDIPNSAGVFNELKSYFNNSIILVVHNKAENESNHILAKNSYDDVLNYVREEYSIDNHAVSTKTTSKEYVENHDSLITDYVETDWSKELEEPPPEGMFEELQSFSIETLTSDLPEETFKETVQDSEPQNNKEEKEETDFNPYLQRSMKMQKEWAKLPHWEHHKSIAVWSPLHRMGVTSFVINFALYLAKNRISVAVLEGLSNNYSMKDWLNRYTKEPENWMSFAKMLQTENSSVHNSNWTYKDVTFLPLSEGDSDFEWNAESLHSYMRTTNFMDITLVDLPTGKMAEYTLDSLSHINELWILVDDSIQDILTWKTYVDKLKENSNLQIYLIFNKSYSFSRDKVLSESLNLKTLVKMQSLHEEVMKNYYQDKPLILIDDVRAKLEPSFDKLKIHLVGEHTYSYHNENDTRINKWIKLFLKPLQLSKYNGKL